MAAFCFAGFALPWPDPQAAACRLAAFPALWCGGAFRFFSGYNVYQEYDEYRSHTTQAALGANARAG